MFQSNPKETDFCLHRQQRFEKTFANESKYYNISVNISAEISNIINVSWVKLALYVKNILDLFKCLTVSTCFTKILTVAIEPPLFTSVGVLCEFAMVPGVYILLSPQEEELNFTPEDTDAHIQQDIYQKDLNLFLFLQLYFYAKVIVESGKHKQGFRLCYDDYDQTK